LVVQGLVWKEASRSQALSTCLDLNPDTLVLDAEPLLIDWRSGHGAWHPGWSALLSEIFDHGVRTVVVVSNSRRDLSSLQQVPRPPAGLRIHCLSRAWKPWTSRRALGLGSSLGSGVVCGDVSLTDGILASRLRYSFVHLKVLDQPLYARIQDRCGTWLLNRCYPPGHPEQKP
jgi:hypothetical protein